jgi:hypothetical protein
MRDAARGRKRKRIASLVAVATLAAWAGNPRPPPPPHPNPTPATALPLEIGQLAEHSLNRGQGILDDWYKVEIPGEGTLRVELSAATGTLPSGVIVAMSDEKGLPQIQPTRAGGRDKVELEGPVQPGTEWLWVGTEPEAKGSIPYQLQAYFTPRPVKAGLKPKPKRTAAPPPVAKPAPPPPAFRTVTTVVVEVERAQGDEQFATIRGGQQMGFQSGLKGRFREAGQVIGTFEIVEVYPKGSRVRVHGHLAGPVTEQTEVDVDVPIASGSTPGGGP